MASENREKWKLLLAQIKVIFKWTTGLSTLNEAQLKDIQLRYNLILPQDYKDYCQVWGEGKFGSNRFFIEIPYHENLEEKLISNKIILNSCKDSYSWLSEVQQLLDNAYLFGGGDGLVSFLFDLRTYSEQEQNYEIYAVACQEGFTYYLGRDFFAFVRDICIGERAKKHFPELLLGVMKNFDEDDPLCQSKTFVPSPIFEEDLKLWEITEDDSQLE